MDLTPNLKVKVTFALIMIDLILLKIDRMFGLYNQIVRHHIDLNKYNSLRIRTQLVYELHIYRIRKLK